MSALSGIEFDLAIRTHVDILVPPAAVWHALGRLGDWKDSVVSTELISGRPGAEGEVIRVGQRPGTTIVYATMRTVRAAQEAWKVQTLQTEGESRVDGYVSYSLERIDGGGTRLRCEVLARCCLPAPPDTDAAELSRTANQSTLVKLDADHQHLKRLLEGKPE